MALTDAERLQMVAAALMRHNVIKSGSGGNSGGTSGTYAGDVTIGPGDGVLDPVTVKYYFGKVTIT